MEDEFTIADTKRRYNICKTLGEWERSLEILNDEELEYVSKGIKALEKVAGFHEDYD